LTPGTPLTETLGRIAAEEAGGLDLSARLGVPEEPGWITSADLLRDDTLLDGLLGRVGRAYGTGDRAVIGALFLRGYLWKLLLPTVAAFLVDRRVPDVGAENVALGFDERGSATSLAFLEGRFAVLEGDPAAGSAGAVASKGEYDMLAWLGTRLAEDHLPGLFAALGRCGTRRAEKALWGMVADLVAEAFAWVGPGLGREVEARAFAEGMLDGSPPIPGTANFILLEHGGGYIPTRVRNACCLYYRVGDTTCLTCPRNTDEERLLRLATG
jgi:hypothetical protein